MRFPSYKYHLNEAVDLLWQLQKEKNGYLIRETKYMTIY